MIYNDALVTQLLIYSIERLNELLCPIFTKMTHSYILKK